MKIDTKRLVTNFEEVREITEFVNSKTYTKEDFERICSKDLKFLTQFFVAIRDKANETVKEKKLRTYDYYLDSWYSLKEKCVKIEIKFNINYETN